MAELEELETLVYCLGPIGGETNKIITEGSYFSSKDDYTKKGYARYIREANNIIKFQHHVINYFMENVKTEFEEDPLAFIDAESEEDMLASIHKMKKHWKEMFKEYQKKLREAFKNPKVVQSMSEISEESSSSSSAKIRKLDRETSSEISTKTSKSESETTSETGEKNSSSDKEAIPDTGAIGVPVEEVEFPKSIFILMLKEFHQTVKKEYQELKARLGKVLERFSTTEKEVQDLKGFTYLKMGKFAKWKYALKTLGILVLELEQKFDELDLDFHRKKENEKRLTDWLYFDDGKRDRKYYHRLLITMELTGPIEEVSALAYKQIKRYEKLSLSLEKKLPSEYEAFKEKAENFKHEVLYNRPMKKLVEPQASNDSGDTLFNVEDMEEEG